MYHNTKKGVYSPINKNKFYINKNKQNNGKIIYRSSWEEVFLKYCDISPHISYCLSEPIAIPYYDEKNKKRKYYPDFLIKMNDKYYIVEIKPLSKINEVRNLHKFKYAKEFCNKKGIEFKIITEREIENLKKKLKIK